MKVGDYVRTNLREEHIITKIVNIKKSIDGSHFLELDRYTKYNYYDDKPEYFKSSPNIIDLIEKGDILKFKDTKHYQEVLAIDNEKLYLTDFIYMSGLHKYKKEIQEDLEWVITHEQIEAIQYEVE